MTALPARANHHRDWSERRACERAAERLHRLGPRATLELLAEIGIAHGIEGDVSRRLTRYAALDPDTVAAVGGHRFPPAPIRLFCRTSGGAP